MTNIFPLAQREQIALARVKNVSKNVAIDPFTLKSITGGVLLDRTELTLEANKKYVLLGENGTGKTTFFAAIASGQVKDFPKHISVHHCKEIETSPDAVSVLETVVRSHEYRNCLLDCEAKLKEVLEAAKAEAGDDASSPLQADIKAYKANLEFIKRQLQLVHSDTAYARAAAMLRVLGFDDAAQTRSTNALSGGLRMRVALSCAFFIEPDLLLLDDPTNHLDFPSVLWLENRLRGYRKSFILVSHDRELLETVCNATIHITEKQLIYYQCSFSEFEKKLAKDNKKKAEDIEKYLIMNKAADNASVAAKDRKAKQDWLIAHRQREIALQGKFTFPPPAILEADPDIPVAVEEKSDAAVDADGNAVVAEPAIPIIRVDKVRFSYDEAKGLPFIFDTPITIDINSKTRIGVMGPNGAGKSTFLKLVTEKLIPNSGTVLRHKTATIAYFSQHHTMELNLQMTPMEFMISQFPEVKNSASLRDYLNKVGVIGAMAETRMIDLSGGQRSCVMFAKLTYVCPHLLIMDEPTNFLDLASVDSLIAATNKYKGALLLVSHNRYFLTKCAKQYLSIVPGQFLLFDSLAKCERATYTFIADLESGEATVDASKLIKKPTDAASVNLAKMNGGAGEPAADAPKQKFVLGSKPKAKPVEKKPEPVVEAPPQKGKPAPAKGGQQAQKAGGKK
jgi:ATPase subunit of ABC transporter with duplicated ATPase domains